MSTMIICSGCGQGYDPSRLGAGKKFCSPRCRHLSRGGRVDNISSERARRILTRKPGAPRKYPTVSPGEEAIIIDLLIQMGVEMRPAYGQSSGKIPHLHVGKRGFMTFLVAMGSNSRSAVGRADAVTFLNEQGDLQIVSACVSGHRYLDKETKRQFRSPCGVCKKCTVSHTLDLVKREFNRRKLAEKGLDKGTPMQHTTS